MERKTGGGQSLRPKMVSPSSIKNVHGPPGFAWTACAGEGIQPSVGALCFTTSDKVPQRL